MNKAFRAAWLAAVLCSSVATSAWSQPSADPLPRRGRFGVELGTDDAGAVIVRSVQPGTTAAEMGVEAGDVVRTVDGVAMQTPADVIAAIGMHRAGERVTLGIARAGVERSVAATLQPFPAERAPGSSVEYGSVALDSGVRLRTIVTVPTEISARAPRVVRDDRRDDRRSASGPRRVPRVPRARPLLHAPRDSRSGRRPVRRRRAHRGPGRRDRRVPRGEQLTRDPALGGDIAERVVAEARRRLHGAGAVDPPCARRAARSSGRNRAMFATILR